MILQRVLGKDENLLRIFLRYMMDAAPESFPKIGHFPPVWGVTGKAQMLPTATLIHRKSLGQQDTFRITRRKN